MSLAGSLTDVRVLDFSRVFAGPLCTQILADLGAEVLKIEHPDGGDDTRAWGPPFAEGESAYFLGLNRGKHSLLLDLRREDDRARAVELSARADVVVENFRVGWMAQRGLDYPTLRSRNPRLVYCSITACGQDGPHADFPGYDFLTQGRAGLMSITGEPDGPPLKVGVAVSDIQTGLYAAIGIQAALLQRERTGEGQYLDISLLDCQIAGLGNVGAAYLLSGSVPGRLGNAHPSIVPYRVFAASDGPFILAVGNDVQWQRLCAALDRREWSQDDRFRTNDQRVRNRAVLEPLLEQVLAAHERDHWLALFRNAEVPAGPVQGVDAVFADPQVLAREMVQTVDHPAIGTLKLTANPLLRHETPQTAPPLLGEGGDEVASSWLRYSPPRNAAKRPKVPLLGGGRAGVRPATVVPGSATPLLRLPAEARRLWTEPEALTAALTEIRKADATGDPRRQSLLDRFTDHARAGLEAYGFDFADLERVPIVTRVGGIGAAGKTFAPREIQLSRRLIAGSVDQRREASALRTWVHEVAHARRVIPDNYFVEVQYLPGYEEGLAEAATLLTVVGGAGLMPVLRSYAHYAYSYGALADVLRAERPTLLRALWKAPMGRVRAHLPECVEALYTELGRPASLTEAKRAALLEAGDLLFAAGRELDAVDIDALRSVWKGALQ